MAEIIQRSSQLEALEEIQAELTQIENLNYALTGRVSYHVMAVDETGAALRVKGRATIPLEVRATEKVDTILKTQRDRLIKSVRQKSSKFEISLDAGDNDVLNGGIPHIKKPIKKVRSANEVEVPEDTAEGEIESSTGQEGEAEESQSSESDPDAWNGHSGSDSTESDSSPGWEPEDQGWAPTSLF